MKVSRFIKKPVRYKGGWCPSCQDRYGYICGDCGKCRYCCSC